MKWSQVKTRLDETKQAIVVIQDSGMKVPEEAREIEWFIIKCLALREAGERLLEAYRAESKHEWVPLQSENIGVFGIDAASRQMIKALSED